MWDAFVDAWAIAAGAVPAPPHPSEELQRGVEANIRWSMQQILLAPEAQAQQAKGRMKLVGAVYEIETGRVRFLD